MATYNITINERTEAGRMLLKMLNAAAGSVATIEKVQPKKKTKSEPNDEPTTPFEKKLEEWTKKLEAFSKDLEENGEEALLKYFKTDK